MKDKLRTAITRKYGSIDLIRFRNFSNENTGLKPAELITAYSLKYPELSAKERLVNMSAALGIDGLHKALTGNDIPRCETCKEVEAMCMCDDIKLNGNGYGSMEEALNKIKQNRIRKYSLEIYRELEDTIVLHYESEEEQTYANILKRIKNEKYFKFDEKHDSFTCYDTD